MMSVPTIDQLHVAWTGHAAARRVGAGDTCHRAALRLLADGEPVAAIDIAEATGQPVAEVEAWLERMRAAAYELDGEGRLVGAALTLRPTAYRFTVRGHDLYTWCGFDTLFVPILLDEPATVASTCPVTGQPIRLAIAADGTVSRAAPATTVVAIVGPEVLETCTRAGPGSAICDQMPLLATTAAAHDWAQERPGVAIVDLNDAVVLARAYADQPGCC